MRISYNPLWKMLIDKNMNKRDLAEKCKISTASVAKLSKGANITTDVLLKSPGTVLVDSSFLMRYNTAIHINRRREHAMPRSHRGRFLLTPGTRGRFSRPTQSDRKTWGRLFCVHAKHKRTGPVCFKAIPSDTPQTSAPCNPRPLRPARHLPFCPLARALRSMPPIFS